MLTRHGCTRIRWEGQGSAGEYQVIPLATIIRKVYVAPDFTEPTGTAFYTSPFMAERGVPDKRHGEDLELAAFGGDESEEESMDMQD